MTPENGNDKMFITNVKLHNMRSDGLGRDEGEGRVRVLISIKYVLLEGLSGRYPMKKLRLSCCEATSIACPCGLVSIAVRGGSGLPA